MKTDCTFNPVQQALRSTRGNILNHGAKQFRLAMCWKCQKDKPRLLGELKCVVPGSAAGQLKRFICAECVVERESKRAERGAA